MNLSSVIRDQLALINMKQERFRELLIRLFSYGVSWMWRGRGGQWAHPVRSFRGKC